MKLPKRIKAPKHLKAATRKWFEQVCQDYELESHHLRLLQLAGEAWDRCQEARELLIREGLTFVNSKNGDIKPHPATALERHSRLAFVRIVRELNLSEDPPDTPRPPGLRYGR